MADESLTPRREESAAQKAEGSDIAQAATGGISIVDKRQLIIFQSGLGSEQSPEFINAVSTFLASERYQYGPYEGLEEAQPDADQGQAQMHRARLAFAIAVVPIDLVAIALCATEGKLILLPLITVVLLVQVFAFWLQSGSRQ